MNLPEDVQKNFPSAFYSCKKITSFCLKSTIIDSIGRHAFCECKKLKKVVISTTNNLTIGEKCFAFCEQLNVIDIKCDSSVLEDFCFECCKSLPKLDFNVKTISFGQNYISGCEQLKSICIPDADDINIQEKSFISLSQFQSIHFKTKKFKISLNSFENCPVSEIRFENCPVSEKLLNDGGLSFLASFDSLKQLDLISHSKLTIKNSLLQNLNALN